MKKIFAVMLCFFMVLSFTACGGNKSTEQENATLPVSDVLVRSVYNEMDGSYYNSYTQLTITPPTDWHVYTDNDLAMSLLGGAVTGDEFAMWSSADFKNKTIIPDFAVMDMANSNELSVVFVNLEQLENAEYMDEDTVLSMIIQSQLEQGRILQKSGDTVVLGDKEFRFLEFNDMSTSWYFMTGRQDNYVTVITATDRSGVGFEMFKSFIG